MTARKAKMLSLACMLAALTAPTVGSASEMSGWYSGDVLNWITTHPGGVSSNDPLNAGVFIGYTFGRLSTVSIEGE